MVNMKNPCNNSLLPYLNQGSGGFHLEVTHGSGQAIENTVSPFLVAGENDPLSRVIKGRIITDAGITVKDLLLLVQRDEYLFSDDSFCTINNMDVERAWQDSFASYLKDGKKDFLLLSGQMSATGGLARMGSLFFCKRTELFFSPPCPACGLPLDQCEDDELLTLAGLKSYTQSLDRYLYCAACTNQSVFRFYASRANNIEQAGVESRLDLIKRFGSLVPSSGGTLAFPCGACQFRDECYGVEQKALSSIVPFSFYPFYMLILSAPTLNMWDTGQKEEKENAIAVREHALRLGWSLITSIGKGRNEEFFAMGGPQKLEMLREGIGEEALLAEMGASSVDSILPCQEASRDEISPEPVANDEVARVLAEIRREWSSRLSEPTPSVIADAPADEDMEESVETVFLTLADLEQLGAPNTTEIENAAIETVMQTPVSTEPSEDADKTVILSAASVENAHPEKQMDMEKTMILNMGQTAGAGTPSVVPPVPQENEAPPKGRQVEIEETVIISAGQYQTGPGAGVIKTSTEPEAGTTEEDGITQPPPGEEDLIEATVILNINDRSKRKRQ